MSKNFHMYSLSVNGACSVGVVPHDYPEKAVAIPGHAAAFSHQKRTHRAAKRPAASRVPAQQTVRSTPSLSERFPIVGIGASAGGLEALEAFFTHMLSDSGMAFVVVTHQPPQHVSLLPDLLGRCTTMPVLKASDGVTIAPNRVYIAPSNSIPVRAPCHPA